jgi:UDP-3-O-[3-hydroxymyristoyl] glucosamine N-acyltransferase
VQVFSGCVIGSDGFGFLENEQGGRDEMPQLGSVVIGDDVRLGAHSTVDRGTLGNTVIGKGTKIDAQVHVGHNCIVGENNVLCGQVGLSGSVQTGKGVIMAGQAGVSHGIKIGDRVFIGGQAGVNDSVSDDQKVFASPAVPVSEYVATRRTIRSLPGALQRLKELESKLGSDTGG